MKYYLVQVPEVYYATVKVRAASVAEAQAKAKEADGELVNLELSHVIESTADDPWVVEELNPAIIHD